MACIVARATGKKHSNELIAESVLAARSWLTNTPKEDLKPFVWSGAKGPFDKVGFCTWSSLGEGELRGLWVDLSSRS